ncbi:hypothetical protein AB0M43_36180 [Longispora sp. NPDC051575]|uniref:hypothetical protein n=1 Tax=Longispora sp. NPDC051575 TaxID=3154943 RepID=UPI0034238FD7
MSRKPLTTNRSSVILEGALFLSVAVDGSLTECLGAPATEGGMEAMIAGMIGAPVTMYMVSHTVQVWAAIESGEEARNVVGSLLLGAMLPGIRVWLPGAVMITGVDLSLPRADVYWARTLHHLIMAHPAVAGALAGR